MAAGSIVVELLAKTGSFETDTKRAEKRLRELEREAKKVGAAIGIAFVAAAGATTLLVKNSIDAADAASKQAKAVGLTTESYTGLAYAADLSGVSQEELAGSLTRLARTAKDADDGVKKSATAFADLGIELRDADGNLKGTDVLLAELADKFAGMPTSLEKTARATDFFGRSGAKLIPLLNEGSKGIDKLKQEAEALGLVIGSETAASAELFNDNLSRLAKTVTGFGNDLTRELLPFLADATDLFVDMAKESRKAGDGMGFAAKFAGQLTGAAKGLVISAAYLVELFDRIGRAIGGAAAQMAAFGRVLAAPPGQIGSAWKGFTSISDAMKEDAARAEAELKRFQIRVMNLGRELGTPIGTENDPRRGRGYVPPVEPTRVIDSREPKAPKAPKLSEAERYLENLRKQLQATADLSVEETVLADIRAGRLGKVSNTAERELVAVAKQIDSEKRLADQLDAEEKQLEELRDSRDKDIESRIDSIKAMTEENDRLVEEIAYLTGGEAALRAAEKARIDSAIATLEQERASKSNAGAMAEELGLIDKQIAKLRERSALTGKRQAIVSSAEEGSEMLRGLALAEERLAVARESGSVTELGYLAKLGEARRDAANSFRTYLEELEASGNASVEQINASRFELERLVSESDPLARKFNALIEDNFADAFVGFIDGSMSASEAMKSFANSVVQQISRIAAQNIAESLFGGSSPQSGGGLGSIIGSLISGAASSGSTSGGGSSTGMWASLIGTFAGLFADGGFIPPGQWGIAGERGPEPVFGGRTGATVQPNSGGRSITVNVSMPQNADRRTGSQFGAQISRELQRAGARGN